MHSFLYSLKKSPQSHFPFTNPCEHGLLCFLVRTGHSPPLISIQFMEHRVVAILEHQVKPPFPPEDFQEVDKVGMLELLKAKEAGW